MEDITETGPVGLKGLKGLNQQQQLADLNSFIQRGNLSPNELSKIYTPNSIEDVGLELGQRGYGDSIYDKSITSMAQAENLNEFRAQTQPWYAQLGGGALKMLTTAGTTVLDGTVGALVGLGQGLANLNDGDPNTGFWSGIWNNSVTQGIEELSKKIENAIPNYQTEWEQNATVLQKAFSGTGAANFWGDAILKNAGFTIGAAASIALTGGVAKALGDVLKVGNLATKIGLATKLADGTTTPTTAGKFSKWLARTFVASNGEASIEAINGVKENERLINYNLEQRKNQNLFEIQSEYYDNINKGMSLEKAKEIYQYRLSVLELDLNDYQSQMQKELTDAGNTIYAANMAILSVSNNLTLGSMIRGGFDTSKSILKQATKTAAGKANPTKEEIGKALLNNELKFTISDASKIKHPILKTAGYALAEATQEGFIEEGSQSLVSTSAQKASQAKLNIFADSKTMLGTMINPDAPTELADYSKALADAYQENFGQLNSPGWTEVAAGFITGLFGVAGATRNSNGKLRPTWRGGIKEAYDEIIGNQKRVEEQLNSLNKTLGDAKFGERVKHAVQQLTIRENQDAALERDDIQAFKNYELQQLISDAVFFRDLGILDDYFSMYDSMSNGISDDDLTELKAMAKPTEGGVSALDKMSDNEIKQLYSNKAKTTLEKIKKGLEHFKILEDQFGDDISRENRAEGLMEMAYLDTLLWDTYRRKKKIKNEIETLLQTPEEERSPIQIQRLRQLNTGVENLNKQAEEIRQTLNEYKKDITSLDTLISKKKEERKKKELYKNAENAIAKYKEASTLQDIVDIYSNSPEDTREETLDAAIERSEGETKENLEQFKNYISDVNAIENFISSENVSNNNKLILSKMLQSIVEEMLADKRTVLSRDTIKERFQAEMSNLQTTLNEDAELSKGITINENGEVFFEDSSIVNDEDFELYDNEGEEVRVPKQGSEAERKINAAIRREPFQILEKDLQAVIDNLDKLDSFRKVGNKKVAKKDSTQSKTKTARKIESTKRTLSESNKKEGEDIEEEEDTNTKLIDKLLTKEEQKYIKIIEQEGGTGVTYYRPQLIDKTFTEQQGKALTNKMNKLTFYLDVLEEDVDDLTTDKINKLLNLISQTPASADTIERCEKILTKFGYTVKPDSSNSTSARHNNTEGQDLKDTDISLNGNQFPKYVKSELNKGNVVEIVQQKNGNVPLQVWLKEQGFNCQFIIDNYLNKIIERDSKKELDQQTPVYYLHSTEQENGVLLAFKYENVSEEIPLNVAGKLVEIDGTSYVIIGTLGYEKQREGTEDQFNSILNNLKDSHNGEIWVVGETTNRVKDISAGALINTYLSGKGNKFYNLRDLLNTKGSNPHNLTADNISWLVIEGTEDNPTEKHIGNIEKGKAYSVDLSKVAPGQVFMYVPASNGFYIPVMVESLFLDQIKDDDSPLIKEIKRLIDIIANPDSSIKDRVQAKLKLNDLLIFTNANNIYINDEDSKINPNTIYVRINGENIKVADFAKGEYISAEELFNHIVSANPRINHSTRILESNPDLYINSNALSVATSHLGTLNSSFYLYPVDSNNKYVGNKQHTPIPFTGSSNILERININGKTLYFNGKTFEDNSGKVIDDPQDLLKTALEIKRGNIKPIKHGNHKYYIINNSVYIDNGHSGLNLVDNEISNTILKSKTSKSKTASKKQKASEKSKKIKKEAQQKSAEVTTLIPRPEDVPTSSWDFLQEGAVKRKVSGITVYTNAALMYPTLGVMKEAIKAGIIRNVIISQNERGNDYITEDDFESAKEQLLKMGIKSPRELAMINPETFDRKAAIEKTKTPKENPKPSISNFDNGTKRIDLKSAEDLENTKNNSTFMSLLKVRENQQKVREIRTEIQRAFNISPNNNQELVQALNDNNIDITSNDLDTILEILKNCR